MFLCRWRAFSVCVLQAALAAAYLSATVSAYCSRSWFAANHEQISVLLEIAAVFVTCWWLSMLRPSELLLEQTSFTSLVFRAYMLAVDKVRRRN